MLAACAAVWMLIIGRKSQGRPVIAYQPRRQVPWTGLDVLIVFLFALVLIPSFAATACVEVFDLRSASPPPTAESGSTDVMHPLGRLLLEGDSLWIVVLAVFAAVVVAPIVEEFLFRVVLQGWLEALETRWRRRVRHLRFLARGSIAVTFASLLFAATHFRRAAPPVPVEELAILIAGFAAARLVALVGAVWFLWWRGATSADLGFAPRKLLRDVALGLLALLAVAPPVILLQWLCMEVVPKGVAADPIPLFFLALALGVLCYRTRSIGPAVVLHMSFNALPVLTALVKRS